MEGYTCKFIDGAALDMSIIEFEDAINRFRPDMVAIHTTTPSIYSDVKHAELCKEVKKDCLTVLVGSHASALPELTLNLSHDVDVIARGEFDYTLVDLAKVVEGKKDPKDILGVTYREGNHVRSTPDRPFIENLDTLPFPSWHHINPKWYFDPVKKYPFLTLVSGRGCPFHCTFCILPQVLMGHKYRFRSPKNVVDEMEYDLKLFPYLEGIMFEDDTLLANKKRCYKICLEIKERDLDIWWGCNVRADTTDSEILKLMRAAGCQLFVVGYESGCQEVLNSIQKGLLVETARKFTKLAKEAGIHIHGCFILGLPGETKETLKRTLHYIEKLKPDTIQVYAATPYPGTGFYEWADKNGFIVTDAWNEYVGEEHEQTCIISYPGLSGDEILTSVNKAYRDFYFNPGNMVNLATKVRSWSDFKRLFQGFLNFFNYWQTYGSKKH